ncbi:hypothetical protein CDL15_Pgr004787 [Punica granatum]|uniref:Uncharacterized protein n=1 Tax=Punica granatum TaxID=22663 RepID=A0A218W6A8_PUNGR|nr:hypothetical protein CDL15_Pgr004787 [Punica granatum]
MSLFHGAVWRDVNGLARIQKLEGLPDEGQPCGTRRQPAIALWVPPSLSIHYWVKPTMGRTTIYSAAKV